MTALGATPQLMAHYPINLPTDYDMGIIRERVRTRGSALDDREGLVMKAYCVREAGVDGATGNQYAPFYLWADTAAAGQFHWAEPDSVESSETSAGPRYSPGSRLR